MTPTTVNSSKRGQSEGGQQPPSSGNRKRLRQVSPEKDESDGRFTPNGSKPPSNSLPKGQTYSRPNEDAGTLRGRGRGRARGTGRRGRARGTGRMGRGKSKEKAFLLSDDDSSQFEKDNDNGGDDEEGDDDDED